MAMSPPPLEPPEHELREEEYVAISHHVTKDELHEQIARHGLEVLDHGVPYVVQAARWRRIDQARREARQRPIDEALVGAEPPADTGHIMGPFEQAVEAEHRRLLADALAGLPDADVLAVWRHVEGISDDQIAHEISARGAQISPAGVRKRRERAIGKLRKMLK